LNPFARPLLKTKASFSGHVYLFRRLLPAVTLPSLVNSVSYWCTVAKFRHISTAGTDARLRHQEHFPSVHSCFLFISPSESLSPPFFASLPLLLPSRRFSSDERTRNRRAKESDRRRERLFFFKPLSLFTTGLLKSFFPPRFHKAAIFGFRNLTSLEKSLILIMCDAPFFRSPSLFFSPYKESSP